MPRTNKLYRRTPEYVDALQMPLVNDEDSEGDEIFQWMAAHVGESGPGPRFVGSGVFRQNGNLFYRDRIGRNFIVSRGDWVVRNGRGELSIMTHENFMREFTKANTR